MKVSRDSDFSSVDKFYSNLSYSSKKISSLSRGTKYYWKVRAHNDFGYSNWSSTWSFTTKDIELPDPPALLSPAYNATNQSTALTFDWESTSNTTKYLWQISRYSDFSPKVGYTNTTSAKRCPE